MIADARRRVHIRIRTISVRWNTTQGIAAERLWDPFWAPPRACDRPSYFNNTIFRVAVKPVVVMR
jgi:hypothetical protein